MVFYKKTTYEALGAILRPLLAKLEHFYLFDPCRAKNLTFDVFFNNYKIVRCKYVKLYFFLSERDYVITHSVRSMWYVCK